MPCATRNRAIKIFGIHSSLSTIMSGQMTFTLKVSTANRPASSTPGTYPKMAISSANANSSDATATNQEQRNKEQQKNRRAVHLSFLSHEFSRNAYRFTFSMLSTGSQSSILAYSVLSIWNGSMLSTASTSTCWCRRESNGRSARHSTSTATQPRSKCSAGCRPRFA